MSHRAILGIMFVALALLIVILVRLIVEVLL